MSAYLELLRGRSLFETRAANNENHRQALEHFELAALSDPGYADALAGIGMARVVGGHGLLEVSYEENVRLASEALDAALKEEPDHPQAVAAYAWLQCWKFNWNSCEDYAARAVALAPGDPFAHYTDWRANTLMGKVDAARAALRRARTLDPLNAMYEIQWGNMLIMSGDIEGGIDYLRALPASEGANDFNVLAYGLTFALRARNAELSRRYMQPVLEAAENDRALEASLPIYDAALKSIEGDKEPLKRLIQAMWKSGDPSTALLPENVFMAAELYELAGEYDDAVRVMQSLYESADIFGPANFGSLEWRLFPALSFSEDLLKHPAYREFWTQPCMAELARIRRENGAPWNLPLPLDEGTQ